ncbi:Hypothetical predicted protein [Olea europaea subsp. europaea]|uniref:Uncharacterized protein n=1 Tax=Olea europaea subsp. europaea TaxID=158383 RepID=A0A8S0PBT3_OLEEU|nr:Hypothetical predicted protein [Olea europaea subsp. europaea]
MWDKRLTAGSKSENSMKKATNSSDGRGKRKVEELHNVSPSKRHKSFGSGLKATTKKVEISDLDSSETKSAMQYMIDVEYTKPAQPDLSNGERRTGTTRERSVHSAGTSDDPRLPVSKTTTPLHWSSIE